MKKSILTALMLFLFTIAMQAQNISVHGTVISKTDNEPLIGASVFCSATKTGTATDIDGNFEISVPEGSELTFSYVGYQSQTLKATPEMNIVLGEDEQLLDELVVVGYQTVKKADLTGSVSVVSTKNL